MGLSICRFRWLNLTTANFGQRRYNLTGQRFSSSCPVPRYLEADRVLRFAASRLAAESCFQEQLVIREGLPQVTDRTGTEHALAHSVVWKSGNEYYRHGVTVGD
jgi:hypothetical protein